MIYKTNKEELRDFNKSVAICNLMAIFFIIIVMIGVLMPELSPAKDVEDIDLAVVDQRSATLFITGLGMWGISMMLLLVALEKLKFMSRRNETMIRILKDISPHFEDCFNDPMYWRDDEEDPKKGD